MIEVTQRRLIPESRIDAVYLRSDTKVEPLASRWYAWPHLLSPVQYAFNLVFRYIPVLRSFIANSSAHVTASHDPEFYGAPFAQLLVRDVPAARALLQSTMQSCAPLIEFARSLVELNKQLKQAASGGNLDHLYEQLPSCLAGLVEICYDVSNRPTLRILEELVYAGGPDICATQEIAFFCQRDEDRRFFLNTPRLDTPERTFVKLAFCDSGFDRLSAARICAVPFAQLANSLSIEESSRARFRTFFDAEPPLRNTPRYDGAEVRVRYFGHACVLIQTSKIAVLIDPVVAFEHQEHEDRLTFYDLPDHIDYVFLTHSHQDHFAPEIFLQLRNRIGRILVPRNNPSCVADPSLKLALRSLGFSNVDVFDALDELPIIDGRIVSIPFFGEHAGLDIYSKQGLYLSLKGRRFLFLADADCVDRALYRRLADSLGKVDVLFIGMECHGAPLSWLYGPYLDSPPLRKDDDSRRLSGSDCNRAWAIVEEFGCSEAFVYAMGQEPWLKHLLGLQYTPESKQIIESDKFIRRCQDAGVPARRLHGCREFIF